MLEATNANSHQTCLLKHDPNNDGINGYVNLEEGKLKRSQPYKTKDRQPRNPENWRKNFPQGIAYQLVTQNQMIRPEIIYIHIAFYRLSRLYFCT